MHSATAITSTVAICIPDVSQSTVLYIHREMKILPQTSTDWHQQVTRTSFLSWRTHLRHSPYPTAPLNCSPQAAPHHYPDSFLLHHHQNVFSSITFDHRSTEEDDIPAVPTSTPWKWRWGAETVVLHGKTNWGSEGSSYPKEPAAFIYLPHSCGWAGLQALNPTPALLFVSFTWWIPQKAEPSSPAINLSSMEQGKWQRKLEEVTGVPEYSLVLRKTSLMSHLKIKRGWRKNVHKTPRVIGTQLCTGCWLIRYLTGGCSRQCAGAAHAAGSTESQPSEQAEKSPTLLRYALVIKSSLLERVSCQAGSWFQARGLPKSGFCSAAANTSSQQVYLKQRKLQSTASHVFPRARLPPTTLPQGQDLSWFTLDPQRYLPSQVWVAEGCPPCSLGAWRETSDQLEDFTVTMSLLWRCVQATDHT